MKKSLLGITVGTLIGALVACSGGPGVDETVALPSKDESARESRETPPKFSVLEFDAGVTARLQAISVVSSQMFWVSGLEGSWAFTEDGGSNWRSGQIEGAEELQIRDIHGVDDQVAYALSAGEGAASRLFKTRDGGTTWQLLWTMSEPEGFLDCFDFWSENEGIAYGDSVGGELFLLTTTDGATWDRIPGAALPSPAGKEGGFAASGTCVRTTPPGEVWIATGAGDLPRVLRSSDRGASWSANALQTVAGSAAGLMSVVVGEGGFAGALGGDLEQSDAHTKNVAWTTDGGSSWELGEPPGFVGAIYGAALWTCAETADKPGPVVAAGPGGVDLAPDAGGVWFPVSRDEYWAVEFLGSQSFVAVGPEGRITRFDF